MEEKSKRIRLDIDTREHQDKNNHILDYLFKNDISYRYVTLNVGDYMLTDSKEIAVDRKSGLMELAQNCNQDHERFRNELLRAQANDTRLYILVEEPFVYSINQVHLYKIPKYKSTTANHKKGEPKAKWNPETLEKQLKTMQEKYGVTFLFCKQEQTAKIIIKILTGKME